MVEKKTDFKYEDPAVLGKAKRTALGSSMLPTVGRAARHLIFLGQPCCLVLRCHHGTHLSWHTHTHSYLESHWNNHKLTEKLKLWYENIKK